MTSRINELAGCLLKAIDEINFSNVIVLLEKHGADPNTIIPKLEIAPIHYAVGFDDEVFAEKVTALFLKKNANPNLVSEIDKLTPLHISCIWGRAKIVQLLLENGGDLNLKCSENQTPIVYAIAENNYQVIEVIQKFIFEQKIDKKKNELILMSNLQSLKISENRLFEDSPRTPIKNNHLRNAIESIDERKFTPNRINYNFDVTSPYFVNITHRRHKTSREFSKTCENNFNDDEQSDDPTIDQKSCRKNLFELTEKNLEDFSQQMSQVIIIDRLAIHKRKSYIKNWQDKIQHVRKANAKLDICYINYLNSFNNVTLMNETFSKANGNDDTKSSSESFITANSDLQRSRNAIQNLSPIKYFNEKKIVCEEQENHDLYEIESDEDDARTQSSVSTKITLPPLDYDTDALRNELTHLTGGKPGPITKNTKYLYLKQLGKLKKKPAPGPEKNVPTYSVELQRTIKNYEFLEENLNEFLKLETQMVQHFLERAHIKWREGNKKTSFVYLLIDPRISKNLPLHYKNMSKNNVWEKFISSIFYVGKGKRSRPYNHLYDAIKLYSLENKQLAERLESQRNQVNSEQHALNDFEPATVLNENRLRNINRLKQSQMQNNKKLNRIIDIWKSQTGIICLHVFNNTIPCEAYSREAAIIEAIGLEHLTNLKKGDFYGVAKNFPMRKKRELGIAILNKAMNVYLAEGESKLMPFDLI